MGHTNFVVCGLVCSSDPGWDAEVLDSSVSSFISFASLVSGNLQSIENNNRDLPTSGVKSRGDLFAGSHSCRESMLEAPFSCVHVPGMGGPIRGSTGYLYLEKLHSEEVCVEGQAQGGTPDCCWPLPLFLKIRVRISEVI